MKRCVIKQNHGALLRHFRETGTMFTIVTTTTAIFTFVRNRHIGHRRHSHHHERHRDGKKVQRWMTTTHVLKTKRYQTKISFRKKQTSFSHINRHALIRQRRESYLHRSQTSPFSTKSFIQPPRAVTHFPLRMTVGNPKPC